MSSSSGDRRVSVLFVCLGNICRSPMAEAVFRHLTNHGKETSHPQIDQIDSAGTGAYHEGDGPDPRTMSTLEANGITDYNHAARKFVPDDFRTFDYILAMDSDNKAYLDRLRARILKQKGAEESQLGRVSLFGSFGGKSKREEVIDPYYGARDGFEVAYEQMVRFSKGLLKDIEEEDQKPN
ncbi:MAG: hypothetical protein M1821_007271 [Bathelium mastoideum]|nr:MAG: hypothetical protein M1821_007271 [Bathelium mastoideum]KAI9694775.1 MAG: hypothetical protein M1822_000391 [Bathelium mastoideum]